MKEKISAIKNLIYYMAGSYMEYFIGLAISILIARSLSPAEYGEYAFLIWLSALGVILVNNGINTAVIKFMAEERGKGHGGYAVLKCLRSMQLKFAFAVSILLMVVAFFWHEEIVPGEAMMVLMMVVGAVFLRSVYMFYASVAKGIERFKVTALTVLFVSPINLLAVFFVSQNSASLETFVAIYVIVSLLYCMAALYWLRGAVKKENGELDAELKGRVSRHVKIVSVNVILGFIIYKQSEIAFLKLLAGSEDVAFYNVGFMLASSAMLLVPGIFSGLLLPLMSRAGVQKGGGLPSKFLSSTRYLIFLSIPVATVGILLSEKLVTLLYGPEYSASSVVLSVCLISSGIAVSAHAAHSYFMSSDNQKVIMKAFAFVAVFNLLLDAVLIKLYGLAGAYSANLIASIVLSLILIQSGKRRLGVKLEYGLYIRLLLVSLISCLPLWGAIHYSLGSIYILGATILFAPLYLLGSILLRCWSKGDYRLFGFVANKVVPGGSVVRYFDRLSSE